MTTKIDTSATPTYSPLVIPGTEERLSEYIYIKKNDTTALGPNTQEILQSYNIIASRRTANANMYWQLPLIWMVAQVILFTVSLGAGTPNAGRYIASTVGNLFTFICQYLSFKMRTKEMFECNVCHEFEKTFGLPILHGKDFMIVKKNSHRDSLKEPPLQEDPNSFWVTMAAKWLEVCRFDGAYKGDDLSSYTIITILYLSTYAFHFAVIALTHNGGFNN